MRRILFRGKRKDNSEWITGYVIYSKRYGEYDINSFIIPIDNNFGFTDSPSRLYFSGPIEVDPETIVQFTGLTDKNGKDTYEGDVVYDGENIGLIGFEYASFTISWYDSIGRITEGGYNEDAGGFGVVDVNIPEKDILLYFEIIGNIHDNPELLNKESK